MIGGGILVGSATLVAGSPGTGKTTLGLHYIAAGIKAGEPGVFVSFEYLPQQIYLDALDRGWPLKQWEEEGKFRLICTTPEILLASASAKGTVLDDIVREIGAKRLVIDSMSQFEVLGQPSPDLRQRVAGLVNHLRLLKVTTLMTHEIAQIVGPTVTISNYGLEFVADNLIVLRYVELGGEMQKAINVLKFRGSAHDRKYRLLELTDQGVVIRSDFAGVENISSGTARRDVADRVKRMV
jgi:circadian clock protein KaiC